MHVSVDTPSVTLGLTLPELSANNYNLVALSGNYALSSGLVVLLGTSATLHDVAMAPMPMFIGGVVTIEMNVFDLISDLEHLSNDSALLRSHGLSKIRLDVSGSHQHLDIADISSLLDQDGKPTALMDQIGDAAQLLSANGIHLELEVGHFGNPPFHINEAQAHTLISYDISFVDHDNIQLDVDVQAAHQGLIDSLTDLEDLGIDTIALTGPYASSGITIQFGGGDLHSLVNNGLPLFTGGPVLLEFDHINQLACDVYSHGDGLANGDAVAMAASGITQVRIDVSGRHNELSVSTIDDLVAANGTASATLNYLRTAAIDLRAQGISLELEVGHIGAEVALQITDAQAKTLASMGISFVSDDNITVVPARGEWHLASSLADLQNLHIDTVTGNVQVDLGETFDQVLNQPIPNFTGTVRLVLDSGALGTSELNVANMANIIADVRALAQHGIDEISIEDAGLVNGHDDGISDSTLTSSAGRAGLSLLESTIAAYNVDVPSLNKIAFVIGDGQAHTLAQSSASFGFVAGNQDVIVDATLENELNASLKDLQQLNAYQVQIQGHDGHQPIVNLGAESLDAAAADALPIFSNAVTLAIDSILTLKSGLSNLENDIIALANDSINRIDITKLSTTELLANSGEAAAGLRSLEAAIQLANTTGGLDAASKHFTLLLSDGQVAALSAADSLYTFTLDNADTIVYAKNEAHLTSTMAALQQLHVKSVQISGIPVISLGETFAELASHPLPVFVTDPILAIDRADELVIDPADAAQLQQTMKNLAGDEFTQVSMSELSTNDVTSHADGLRVLESSINAAYAGNDNPPIKLHLTDDQAQGLAQIDGFAFTAGNKDTAVDAKENRLTTSLKDLEKINIDAVSLSGAAAIDLTVQLGSTDLHGLTGGAVGGAGLPVFEGGNQVSLETTSDVVVGDLANLSADAASLSSSNIDNINIDVSGNHGALNVANLDSLFDEKGASTTLLNNLHTAATDLAAHNVGLQLEVGHISSLPADALHISAAQAQTLIADGLSFVAHDNIAMDVSTGTTHLSNSLKDLEKLHVDAVAIAAGTDLTIQLGDTDLHSAITGAAGGAGELMPVFEGGGHVALEMNASDLTADLGHLTGGLDDAAILQARGITEVNLDISGNHGALNVANLDSLFDEKGASTTLLNNLHTAATDLAAHNVGLQLEVGHNTVNAEPFVITAAQAQTLIADGLSFVSHDSIAMQVGTTHLSSSLKQLEKLHVDAVLLTDDAATHGLTIHAGLGETVADLVANNLPDFIGGHVNLDLDNANNINGLSELINDQTLVNALVGKHVDYLSIHEAIDLSAGNDWMHLDSVHKVVAESNNLMHINIDIAGTQAANTFSHLDAALKASLVSLNTATDLSTAEHTSLQSALNGLDLLSGYTTPDKFGDLINALTASGVSDMVVDSGHVEISDSLASALVSAGMLQALPESNLVIDATSDVQPYVDNVGHYAHLFTNLNSMADLGVDQIQAGVANKVYVDLGLPSHDATAMADISNLLSALDPANAAKDLAVNSNGNGVGIGLVISGDLAHNIAQSGGLSVADLNHLHNLGITEIDVLAPTADIAADPSVLAHASSAAPVVPEVKLIGAADPMFNELDHHNIVLPPHK
ncbi:hypothetical protein G6645_06755 [Polynucleobacter paneuropaeus]|nr:hypothetical protein [Polynucleobacter paneuropaeus]MBT8624438.1 hypothetical protein [Polynucleobacter paneuropaeus]MBT8628677.1 hypothetical protein [Polynucleobacter paneuropaeus]